MRIARESWILAVICIADLITTIWFVSCQGAEEANPLMQAFLAQGYVAFVLAKVTMFVGPLAILEWARRRRPKFVQGMLRLAIVGYLGSYGIVVWRANAAAGAGTYSDEETFRIVREAEGPIPYEPARNHRKPTIHLRATAARQIAER